MSTYSDLSTAISYKISDHIVTAVTPSIVATNLMRNVLTHFATGNVAINRMLFQIANEAGSFFGDPVAPTQNRPDYV